MNAAAARRADMSLSRPAAPVRVRHPNMGAALITVATYVGILVIFALPMLWIVLKSFQPEDAVFSGALSLADFTFENYLRAVQNGSLWAYTVSTVLISLATSAIVLPLGFLGGYALARFEFRGRDAILLMFMFSLTIPGLVNLLAVYQAFNLVRLINNPVGLVIVYTASNLPLATWLTRAFVVAIPPDIEEASLVDGCSRFAAIWRIVLPLAMPGLGAVVVFVVVNVFQEYIIAQTLVTTRGVGVVNQGLEMMQSQYGLDYTGLAAGSILVSIVPVALFLLLQRQFIAGMTAGAVTS